MSSAPIKLKATQPAGRVRWWSTHVGLPTLGGLGITVLIAAAALFTPASPLALGGADALLGHGRPAQAVAHYETVGAASPILTLRKEAWRRAARVHELELDQPAEARRALGRLLELGVDAAEKGRIHEQLAELHLAERDTSGAALQYRLAWDADPSDPVRLVRAAELRGSIAEFNRARALWTRLRKEAPPWAPRANFGLGELALAQGKPAQAMRSFQLAARTSDADLKSAARLGLAVVYERLGELDGAMAELDQVDLPRDLRDKRKTALRERAAEMPSAEREKKTKK